MSDKNNSNSEIRDLILNNLVIIMFTILCILGIYFSGVSADHLIREIVTRITRNLFLVLALIIPVVAGMGLNFSIVIGAMATQLGIIFATNFGLSGMTGILVIFLVCTPLAVVFGFLSGSLLNKMKGQEMIGGMIMGYFTNGIYQFFVIFVLGNFIPIRNKDILIPGGIGIKNIIDLMGTIKYALDKILPLPTVVVLYIILGGLIIWNVYSIFREKRHSHGRFKIKTKSKNLRYIAIAASVIAIILITLPNTYRILYYIEIPTFIFFLISLAVLFNNLILKTKIGQDMRTVGQDRTVANSAGIEVDKTRIIAIIISTVMASWGHLIYLQNIGTFSTYEAHSNVGLFAIASLLVGGASIDSAKSTHAIIGVVLFHTLSIVAPGAATAIFNNAQIGEYFRVFLAYAVICVALVLHARKILDLSKIEHTE